MPDMQRLLLDWIAAQPGMTGLAIFLTGLMCAVTGTRFVRFLAVIAGAGTGAVVASVAAGLLGFGGPLPLALGAVAVGGAAIYWPAALTVLLSGVAWAVVGLFVFYQFGARNDVLLVVLSLAGLLGTVLTALSRHAMTVVITSIMGSSLMVLGFVGLAVDAIPSMGYTLRSLFINTPIATPILIGMLTVTTYSYQANSFRGDIVTGGVGDAT